MIGDLALVGWLGLLIGGIAGMQWGASSAATALEGLRDRGDLRSVAVGALLGIATATPEIAVNLASVGLGWPDLGLGAALGSNVPALPLVFLIAWAALRRRPVEAVVVAQATPVQAIPYLCVVILLALLTLPPGWSGLQPVDALALFAAWLACLFVALRQPRQRVIGHASPARAPRDRTGMRGAAVAAVPAIAVGALAAVVAARRLGEGFGASDLVVGLFVIGLLCALPESFAAWRLAREGRTTVAVATAMSDGIVSLTLALVAPALVGSELGDPALFVANLGFLAIALVAYIVLNHPRYGQELGARRVALFAGGYAAYLLLTVWLLWPSSAVAHAR